MTAAASPVTSPTASPAAHAALMAGVDETLLKPRSIAAKIAALLPFPLWRLPWRSKGAKAASTGGSHHLAGAGSAGLVPSAGSALTFGQAAATVAVIVAGAGGGLAVHGLASGGHGHDGAATHSTHRRIEPRAPAPRPPPRPPRRRIGRASLSRAPARSASRDRDASAQPARHAVGRRGSAPGSGRTGGGSGVGRVGAQQGTAAAGRSPRARRPRSSTASRRRSTGCGKTVTGAGKTVGGVANGVTNGVDKTVHNVTGGVSTPSTASRRQSAR